MTDDAIKIEGLMPWCESGELFAILTAIARWYEETDDETDLRVEIQPWGVPTLQAGGRPGLDLKPILAVSMTYGPRGSRGSGEVLVWRGANPARVTPALDECLETCRRGYRQRREAGRLIVPDRARIELAPSLETDR